MNNTISNSTSTDVRPSMDKLKVPVKNSGKDVDLVSADRDNEENEIKQTWRLFTSKRMLKLVPLLCYSGISMAVYQAALVPLMTITMDPTWDDNKQIKQATLAQVGLGVGEVVGGLINGEV
jgi:hypothetical protein